MNKTSPLAALVTQRRQDLGMTQADLAAAVERSQEWVSKIESGRITNPHKSTLQRLARVLGVDVADLYIAAQLADSQSAARRIAQTLPEPIDPDDPRQDLVKLLYRFQPSGSRLSTLRLLMMTYINEDRAARAEAPAQDAHR